MSNESQTTANAPSDPVLCKMGCGFFVSPYYGNCRSGLVFCCRLRRPRVSANVSSERGKPERQCWNRKGAASCLLKMAAALNDIDDHCGMKVLGCMRTGIHLTCSSRNPVSGCLACLRIFCPPTILLSRQKSEF